MSPHPEDLGYNAALAGAAWGLPHGVSQQGGPMPQVPMIFSLLSQITVAISVQLYFLKWKTYFPEKKVSS